ncbi:MAG: DUF3473 domain-containing protein [Acidimicrobiales bacterium]
MSHVPCLTVDVEDFYEGMHTLGHDVIPPHDQEPGVTGLQRLLEGRSARITLFVVGRHAAAAGETLRALAASNHEIASHGPDHGRLPSGGPVLIDWLRRGREMLEDVVGQPVRGFRSPRFDVPADLSVTAFRDALAEAGFLYVSDRSSTDGPVPLEELPVATRWQVPFGGGSYQRLLPRRAVSTLVRLTPGPCVLYYHSYDFGHELPALRSARSTAVVSQLLGRGRVAPIFERLLDEVGSQTCTEALRALR